MKSIDLSNREVLDKALVAAFEYADSALTPLDVWNQFCWYFCRNKMVALHSNTFNLGFNKLTFILQK